MTSAISPKPSRIKVGEHRARLRAQGLRPIQIWVPDVRAPKFRSEAHRQSLAVATSTHAEDNQAFIDDISALDCNQCDGGVKRGDIRTVAGAKDYAGKAATCRHRPGRQF